MKRLFIVALLVVQGCTFSASCESDFEKRCHKAGGVVHADNEELERRCYKDGKEISV